MVSGRMEREIIFTIFVLSKADITFRFGVTDWTYIVRLNHLFIRAAILLAKGALWMMKGKLFLGNEKLDIWLLT